MRKLFDRNDISNGVITPGTCFPTFVSLALVSSSGWLAEIWQLSRRGATGELEVEFNLQRRDVVATVVSFLFLPRRQSASESLLTG